MTLAHGVGGRGDLPIPFSWALGAAVVTLLVTAVVLDLARTEPWIRGRTAGHPLPAWWDAGVRSRCWRWTWRVAGLVGLGWTAVAAVGGPDDALNPTAGVVYVLLWVALVSFASALLGPVWRALNPLRTLHLLGARVLRTDPSTGVAGPYPRALGSWPAAFFLLAFLWLELVGPERASTVTLRWWFLTYAAVQLLGAVAFGERWFGRADGFEVWSTLVGRLSVLGRRGDGVLVVRSPLAGLDALRAQPGRAAVVVVMLGGTAYDGITQGLWWARIEQRSALGPVGTGTLGLLATIAVVAAVFGAAAACAGPLCGRPARGLVTAFAPSLVPVALGYVVAHYWSLFVLVGQQTLVQLSDPLGRGDDLLGIGDRGISYALVSPTFTVTLQVVAVVLGHVVGIVLAHDRAARLLPRRRRLLAQLPLVLAMVVFTLAGLLLLLSG